MKKRYIVGFIIVSIIVLLDQTSKFFIDKLFNVGDSLPLIKNIFNLTYYRNLGAAFGIFQGSVLFLILASLLILMYLVNEMKRNINNKMMFCSFIVLIGGLIGNLIDRILFGYVRDFFEFKIFNYNFPIFNVSDICITFGVIALIIFAFVEERNGIKDKKRRK